MSSSAQEIRQVPGFSQIPWHDCIFDDAPGTPPNIEREGISTNSIDMLNTMWV